MSHRRGTSGILLPPVSSSVSIRQQILDLTEAQLLLVKTVWRNINHRSTASMIAVGFSLKIGAKRDLFYVRGNLIMLPTEY